MAKLFGRLNNLAYRGGETETANVVIDGGVITVSVDTSKIATNEYVDSNIEVVIDDITQHKNNYNNPHKVTKAQVGLDKVDNTADIDKPISTATKTALDTLQSEIEAHIEDDNNPHQVTAEQVGLGNVNNTSDENKPVSILQQQALDKKVDKVEGKGLSTNDYDDTAVAEVAKIKDKADTATVTALTEQVATKTNVTVNGEHVATFDADTKLDKSTKSGSVYAVDSSGNQINITYATNPNAWTIAYRRDNGVLSVGTPSADNDATTKKYVDGIANGKLNITGGTITSDLAVQGNLTVSGTTTTEHQKQLLVEDNVIVTNANKTDLQSLLSGIAINKNSNATYGIMYDPSDDTVKFGQGTLDENNKFVFNTEEGLPIAIRAQASDFTDAHLVKWDATKNAFVDSGYTGDDIASKTNVTVNGEHVDTFNADTKLDKVNISGIYTVYGTTTHSQTNFILQSNYISQVRPDIIPTYANSSNHGDTEPTGAGVLITNVPNKPYQAANKKYVDDIANTKVNAVSGSEYTYRVYGTGDSGENRVWMLSYGAYADKIPLYKTGGALSVGTPSVDSDATTKEYVDGTISSATSITILEASDA